MDLSHKIITFFSLVFTVSVFVLLSNQPIYAQSVPSPACLGSCPVTPDPTSILPPSPTQILDRAITISPPCTPTTFTSDIQSNRHNNKNSQDQGLFSVILQLIILLIQLVLGGGTAPLPTPTPIPQPTHIPTIPCDLAPTAVLPTAVIATLIPTAPSSQNPTTAPTQAPIATLVPTMGTSSAPSPLPGGGGAGLSYPPNLIQSTTMPGYYQLPPTSSPNSGYTTLSCGNKLWGARELVGFLYTVGQRWRQKYPQGYIRVADMNGSGHEPGHTTGESVDLDATTNGTDCVADFIASGLGGDCGGTKYNREATIELAKIIIDTGIITRIIYLDQTVNAAMDEYAKSKGATRNVSLERPAHDNHFHVDLKIPKLATWAQSC